jgi:hypothetical protein
LVVFFAVVFFALDFDLVAMGFSCGVALAQIVARNK